MIEEHLTVAEAKINNKQTQLVDFEHETCNLVSGLPGFVRQSDRVKQLKMLNDTKSKNDFL